MHVCKPSSQMGICTAGGGEMLTATYSGQKVSIFICC